MKQTSWDFLDRQALDLIQLMLASNIAFNIMKEKATMRRMNVLSNMYKKPSAINKVYMMWPLFHLKMGEGVQVVEHISESNVVASQLSSVCFDFFLSSSSDS